jgi:hypothetical protein
VPLLAQPVRKTPAGAAVDQEPHVCARVDLTASSESRAMTAWA